ncbi:MAG: hypothetical protein DRP08_06485, partial [Candidatus Aenigmatarchaeota archaeon]
MIIPLVWIYWAVGLTIVTYASCYIVKRYPEWGYPALVAFYTIYLGASQIMASRIVVFDLGFWQFYAPAAVFIYPFTVGVSKTEMKKRQLTTLRNTSIMAKLNEGVELIPVIHASHILSAKWFLGKLNEIGEFNVYGIGSLVPMTRRSKGYVLTVEKAVRIIHFLRQELPDKKIHAFGVGGSRLMHLIFYAGANWVDSMSWFIEAINGWVEVLFEDGIVKKKRFKQMDRHDIQAL